MITGFRWHRSGAQHVYGVQPDLSTFGKALANGFAVSALAGRREIMHLGGLDHDRERVFLLSTTHGAETHSLAAAIATMETYRDEQVIEHLYRQGERLRSGIHVAARPLASSSTSNAWAGLVACCSQPAIKMATEPGIPCPVPARDDPPRRPGPFVCCELFALRP